MLTHEDLGTRGNAGKVRWGCLVVLAAGFLVLGVAYAVYLGFTTNTMAERLVRVEELMPSEQDTPGKMTEKIERAEEIHNEILEWATRPKPLASFLPVNQKIRNLVPDCRYGLYRIYRHQKKWTAAREEAERALALKPKGEWAEELKEGIAELKEKEAQEAAAAELRAKPKPPQVPLPKDAQDYRSKWKRPLEIRGQPGDGYSPGIGDVDTSGPPLPKKVIKGVWASPGAAGRLPKFYGSKLKDPPWQRKTGAIKYFDGSRTQSITWVMFECHGDKWVSRVLIWANVIEVVEFYPE